MKSALRFTAGPRCIPGSSKTPDRWLVIEERASTPRSRPARPDWRVGWMAVAGAGEAVGVLGTRLRAIAAGWAIAGHRGRFCRAWRLAEAL